MPSILHSDNGLEFKNVLVKNLVETWPGACKIVHGKPRCPWVQGKVEQSNFTLQKILASLMAERKKDTWSEFLCEVQYIMNTNIHSVSKTTPYKIVFGQSHNLGIEGIVDGGDEESVDEITSDITSDDMLYMLADPDGSLMDVDNEAQSKEHSEEDQSEEDQSEEEQSEEEQSEEDQSEEEQSEEEQSEEEQSEEEQSEQADDTRNLKKIREAINKSREKMVFKHNRKKNKVTKELKIGDNVAINIPKIDRGHSDLSRLPGTIIAIHGKNSRLLTYSDGTH